MEYFQWLKPLIFFQRAKTGTSYQGKIWDKFKCDFCRSFYVSFRLRPIRKAYEQSPSLVKKWLKSEFPRIKKLAKEEKATIYFGDEAGLRSDYHSGTT